MNLLDWFGAQRWASPTARRVSSYSSRRLTEHDVDEFLHAAEDRPPIYQRGGTRRNIRVSTQAAFIQKMKRARPLRFRRLQNDVKWLRREAAKAGIDPDEVRWML